MQHYFTVSSYSYSIDTAQSIEIYREIGLYEEVRKESAKLYDENTGIVDVESLAGKFLRR